MYWANPSFFFCTLSEAPFFRQEERKEKWFEINVLKILLKEIFSRQPPKLAGWLALLAVGAAASVFVRLYVTGQSWLATANFSGKASHLFLLVSAKLYLHSFSFPFLSDRTLQIEARVVCCSCCGPALCNALPQSLARCFFGSVSPTTAI